MFTCTVTDAAVAHLDTVLSQEEWLRVAVSGTVDGRFEYDLSAVPSGTPGTVAHAGPWTVVVPDDDVSDLDGFVLDWSRGTLVLRNPNRPTAPVPPGLVTDSALATAVRAVIETRINPNLDAHGGYVQFVGHDDAGVVHLSMHGGCAGCSMASSTMFDGVGRVLVAEVAGVVAVRDCTDHAAGTDPYYR